MRRSHQAFVSALNAYTAALTLAILGVVLLGVFFRYIVNQALSWYDEFAGYLLVWLTMYGSVVALARGMHIGFDALREKFPPAGQRVVDIFATLCVLGFSGILAVSSWVLVKAMAAETAVSLPEVKMAWVYSALPICGALMALVSLAQLVALCAGERGPWSPRRNGLDEGQ